MIIRRTMTAVIRIAAVALSIFLVAQTSSAQTTSQPDLLARIKQKKEIVIATEARLPPFEFVDNGKIAGYDEDLLNEVLKDLPGVQLHQID